MLYLDANFFIFALLDTGAQGERARALQGSIMKGAPATTSVLTIDELLWVLLRNKKAALLRTAVEDIYALPNLTIREVPANIPLMALDMMERHRLKPRDAFHAAIMSHFGIKKIVSDDADFDRVPGISRVRI